MDTLRLFKLTWNLRALKFKVFHSTTKNRFTETIFTETIFTVLTHTLDIVRSLAVFINSLATSIESSATLFFLARPASASAKRLACRLERKIILIKIQQSGVLIFREKSVFFSSQSLKLTN